jgi:hypothetical protein
MRSPSNFFAELVRRKVVRLVGAYIALFWLLAEGYASLYEGLGLPDWTLRALLIGGIALVPILAFVSWKYDVVPPQIIRDSKDVADANPAVRWAANRHENVDGGFILLRWEDTNGVEREKRFFRPATLGRGPTNDLDLADDRVSRFHAVLWAEEGAWRVRDLDSANGTFIDGVLVKGSATLPQSCELRLHIRGPAVHVHIDKPVETRIA